MRSFRNILRASTNPGILSLRDKSSFLGYFSQSINPNTSRNNRFASTSTHPKETDPEISALVDDIKVLTLLEVADLTEVLKRKVNFSEMPIMSMMMPVPVSGVKVGRGEGGASDEQQIEQQICVKKVSGLVDDISNLTLIEVAHLSQLLKFDEFPKMIPGKGVVGEGNKQVSEEITGKPAFDLKLEGFDAARKTKIIQEIKSFTDLGTKEAKELVEKAPTLLKKGVSEEEGGEIIEKMTALGAKVTME